VQELAQTQARHKERDPVVRLQQATVPAVRVELLGAVAEETYSRRLAECPHQRWLIYRKATRL